MIYILWLYYDINEVITEKIISKRVLSLHEKDYFDVAWHEQSVGGFFGILLIPPDM